MKKSATDSFVLTMPFRYEPWQRDCLDKAFRIAGGIYNSLVANRKKALEQSVGNKAPALFLNILEKKVQDKGGQFHRIDTWSAKASQYDHTDMSCKKKDIGERWALLSDGHRIQRDLYSAYLLKCTNDTLDGFIQRQLEDGFEQFLQHHAQEIERLSHMQTPCSTGVRCQAA